MKLEMNQYYPYGQCADAKLDIKEILVHQQIQLTDCKVTNYQQKIQVLQDKRFGKSCMTQLREAKIEYDKLHVYYEYIPIQLGEWVASIGKNMLLQYRDRLLNFASLLAQKNIKTEFNFTKLGLNNDQQISYFLGLDFNINLEQSTEKLQFHYWNKITQFFDPLIYQDQIKMRNSADSDNLIFSSEGLQKIDLDSISKKKDIRLQNSMDLAQKERIINQFKHPKQHNNFDAHSCKSGQSKKKDYQQQFEQLLSPNGTETNTSQDGMKKSLKRLSMISEPSVAHTPAQHAKQQYSKIVNCAKKNNYISQFEQLLSADTPGQEKPTKDIIQLKKTVSIDQSLKESSNDSLKIKANNSIQNSMKLLEKLRNRIK